MTTTITTATDCVGLDAATILETLCPMGEAAPGVEVEQDWDAGRTVVRFGDGSSVIVDGPDIEIVGAATLTGYEIVELGEGRWSVRIADLDLVPQIEVCTGVDEHGEPITRPEYDWGNAAWPTDDELAAAIGRRVRFVDGGDGDGAEAIYEAV